MSLFGKKKSKERLDPFGFASIYDFRKNYDRFDSLTLIFIAAFLFIFLGFTIGGLQILGSVGLFIAAVFIVFWFVWYKNNK